MFEQDLDNQFSDIWFDNQAVKDADEEGIGFFEEGFNTFHSIDAKITICKYDSALKCNHYSAKKNRLIAQRNSIVSAFGPKLVDIVGFYEK